MPQISKTNMRVYNHPCVIATLGLLVVSELVTMSACAAGVASRESVVYVGVTVPYCFRGSRNKGVIDRFVCTTG